MGIIAGLLLVGIQVKQNSDLLRTQLLYEESHRAIELETKVVGEDGAIIWAKSMTDPESLSLAEQRVMEALLWSFTEQLRATRLLAELGLLDDQDWRVRVQAETGYYLGNRYGTAWWKNYTDEDNPLPRDLKDAIDAQLLAVSPSFTVEYTSEVLDILKDQSEHSDATSE